MRKTASRGTARGEMLISNDWQGNQMKITVRSQRLLAAKVVFLHATDINAAKAGL